MQEINLYIDILKIGRENINKSFSRDEFMKLIEFKGYDLKDNKVLSLFNYCIEENFNSSYNHYSLKSKAFFQLLENERLEEARNDSRKAYFMSFLAFIISSILLVIQIIIMMIK